MSSPLPSCMFVDFLAFFRLFFGFQFLQIRQTAEVGPDPECQSRLRQDSAFFFWAPDQESKIWEKPYPDPESLFNYGSSRSLCGHFLSKNMGKLRLDR